jgi:hypothetical protein
MKFLEDYRSPNDAEMKGLTLDEAERIDALNKEIHLRNRLLVHNARAILQEAEPAAKLLKTIEPPAPPVVYTRVIQMLGARGDAAAARAAAAAVKKKD